MEGDRLLPDPISYRWTQAGLRSERSEWNIRDIDADSPVYPLRGSLDMYACNLADPKIKAATGFDKYSRGKNCFLYHEPTATGVCYKTGFGDWRCSLGTTPLPSAAQTGIPGPR